MVSTLSKTSLSKPPLSKPSLRDLVADKDLRVAAFDLDDTLLRSDKSLAEPTLAAIRDWVAAGNRVIFASGRAARSIAEALPADYHAHPWVCCNGAEIYDNGSCIFADHISEEDARAILAALIEAHPEIEIAVEMENKLYLNRAHLRASEYEVVDLLTAISRPSKILFRHSDETMVRSLMEALPPLTRTLLSPKYRDIQIISHSADKAHGIARVVETWGCSLENVVAFGDDINDLGMVRDSGFGVAVENAIDEVKEVANYITRTNDEDGVAHVLREILASSSAV